MKKVKIGKVMMDAISEEEFIRRTELNPKTMKELSDDTAVIKNGHVFPIQKQFAPNNVGVYDQGPVLIYNKPENLINNPDYNENNIIDFENTTSLRDCIEKTAKFVNQERTTLISPENIYTPIVKEDDSPEMALFKEAIAKKRIDIENYKPRFGSDYSNDLRGLTGKNITFFKLKRLCDIFDINCSVTFSDKKNAPNPIGETLSICINDSTVDDNKGDK